MSALVYLAGPPGAGKTTVMGALTHGCDRLARRTPLRHDLLLDRDGMTAGIELGARRDQFGGTDALPMNVAPAARAWMADHPARLVLGEGDRLAIMSFLDAAAAAGYTVHLVYLHADPATLDARCDARGSAQNLTWRAGRVTKAARLYDAAVAAGHAATRLDTAAQPPGQLAATLAASVPALAALPAGRAPAWRR